MMFNAVHWSFFSFYYVCARERSKKKKTHQTRFPPTKLIDQYSEIHVCSENYFVYASRLNSISGHTRQIWKEKKSKSILANQFSLRVLCFFFLHLLSIREQQKKNRALVMDEGETIYCWIFNAVCSLHFRYVELTSTFHISMFHSIYRQNDVVSSFDTINGLANKNIAILVFCLFHFYFFSSLCIWTVVVARYSNKTETKTKIQSIQWTNRKKNVTSIYIYNVSRSFVVVWAKA